MVTSISLAAKHLDITLLIGKKLGGYMRPGGVIALIGELGAGKTTLVQAIAGGLGISSDAIVCSPSYTLVNEYDGRIPLYHFDFYRLEGADDIDELGFDEYMEGDGVCVVEWADVAPGILPEEHLEIRISITGDETRTLDITGKGERYKVIVERLKNNVEEEKGAC